MSETVQAQPTREAETADGKAIACKVYSRGHPLGSYRQLSDISEILQDEGSLVWLDVVDPGPNDLAMLQEEFSLHPLSIEDAIQAHQRPKVEAYEDSYWFVVVKGTSLTPDAWGIVFHEMAIFAGKQFLVTVRHTPVFPLEEIERRWNAHPEQLRKGSGFLLYTILDTVVDGYFPVVDGFQEHVDEIEDNLFANRPLQNNTMEQVFMVKKVGQQFRHAVLPVRDILTPIMRDDLKLFAPGDMAYFRDVYDHASRIVDQLDSLRDLTSSALEIHLSIVANRQNEVAKQLTIIATIFLPLSFFVGFFGQNFEFLVAHITGTGAFWGLGIGTELVAIAIMLGYFKWRGWF